MAGADLAVNKRDKKSLYSLAPQAHFLQVCGIQTLCPFSRGRCPAPDNQALKDRSTHYNQYVCPSSLLLSHTLMHSTWTYIHFLHAVAVGGDRRRRVCVFPAG